MRGSLVSYAIFPACASESSDLRASVYLSPASVRQYHRNSISPAAVVRQGIWDHRGLPRFLFSPLAESSERRVQQFRFWPVFSEGAPHLGVLSCFGLKELHRNHGGCRAVSESLALSFISQAEGRGKMRIIHVLPCPSLCAVYCRRVCAYPAECLLRGSVGFFCLGSLGSLCPPLDQKHLTKIYMWPALATYSFGSRELRPIASRSQQGSRIRNHCS